MAHKRSDIALLILAAGGSSRMGQAKQLLPWGKTTLLGYTLEQAHAVAIRRKYLLLGARAQHIMDEVDISGFIPVLNPNWEQGMGTGIAHAVSTILNDIPALKGVMIILADQPGVDTVMLNEMLEHFEDCEKDLLACAYNEKAGVPAIISGSFVRELRELKGDKGARSLFVKYKDALERYPVNKPLADIDDPETYRALHREYFGDDPGP